MCRMETWLLEDYAEGVLGVAETAILEAHLNVCVDCRRELSHIKLLFWELESMRRESIEIPAEIRTMEKEILDSWLSGKETWLQQTRSQLAAATKMAAGRLPALPRISRIPGARVAAGFAGRTSAKTAKWLGRIVLRQVKDKLPRYAEILSQSVNERADTERDADRQETVVRRKSRRLGRTPLTNLFGGGG